MKILALHTYAIMVNLRLSQPEFTAVQFMKLTLDILKQFSHKNAIGILPLNISL
jgi:hypothetical protein